MPDPRPLRTLPEPEFTAIKSKILAEAPDNLSEKDFEIWIGPRLAAAVGEAEASAEPLEGSALSRFASNAGAMLNPVSMIKGAVGAVVPEAWGGTGPLNTLGHIGRASLDQGRQAYEAATEGRVSEAVGHGLGTIPLIGPAAAAAGEQIGRGDIAGGLGTAAGLLIPAGAPAAVRATAGAVRTAVPQGVRVATAEALERGAAGRLADVMSPKVGANKTRLANTAHDVAPALAAERGTQGGLSREALHGKVAVKLDEATTALDAAADARLAARSFPTKPLIDALKEKVRTLTSEALDASTEPGTVAFDRTGRPTGMSAAKALGSDVVPSPSGPHVAVLQRAIKELETLGPTTRYDEIRKIRMSYDGPAKVKYNPSMTADYLKNQGAANAAADITGVLRETLAKWDPQTAQANAGYSLYKSAHDVLEAAAEVERARPTMFRKAMTRVTGAAAGGGVGVLIAEVAEQVAGAGWTTKLKTAQLQSKLATALRKGDQGAVEGVAHALRRLGAQAATLTGATSPSGLQTQTTGPTR